MIDLRVRYTLTDSAFGQVPEHLTPAVMGPVDLSGPLGQVLARAGKQSVAEMPLEGRVEARRVKRQRWWTSDDVDEVRAMELPHACEICERGRATLVSFLEQSPGRAVAWGLLELEETIAPVRLGTVADMREHTTGMLTGDKVPEPITDGETCSMCHHPLDLHELWTMGDTTPLHGKMTCPSCGCLSDWSADALG